MLTVKFDAENTSWPFNENNSMVSIFPVLLDTVIPSGVFKKSMSFSNEFSPIPTEP